MLGSQEALTSVLSPAPPTPVGLPDVDGILVRDAVLLSLFIQQVEEVLHSQGHRAAGAEDHLEQVIHKLLQCTLREDKAAQSPGRKATSSHSLVQAPHHPPLHPLGHCSS